ncbi:serine hydrolase [Paenibacillus sp. MER TA 81-3]|uniref:serine hydrolase n=1 Tax=Paenibacillus sp. MER TA 81-3 TaxID=2939573 RepID=UPI00203D398D|nr:serine hydrolase [Paenibacillus sp. MER TA 81-3]MCM3337694.1 serine hydrolase [Paenibacillus sp. MER TA 81-3]
MIHSRIRKKAVIILASLLMVSSAVPSVYASSAEAGSYANKSLGLVSSKEVEAFADEFFERQDVKDMGIPGAVFVVVKDGKVLLQKGYGYADIDKKTPTDPEKTVFRIASVSKVFTATAVMQLAEQGEIDVNHDVQEYMGDIKIKNNTDFPVTVEHLLTHTTGFDIVDPPQGDSISYDLSKVYPLKEYVKEWMPTVIRKPGDVFKYDNIASMLQGYIVQNMSGLPFNQYVNENIFKPLGMNNSGFLMTPELREKLAAGYNEHNKTSPIYHFAPNDMPHGGMLTTGSDMAKFMIAFLNKGKLDGNRILKEETVKEMSKVHMGIHPKVPNMAYGFEYAYQDYYNGQNVIGKSGAAPGGFSSWMWLLPEQNVGAFIVYNKSGKLQEKIFKAFMDRYYPKPEPAPKKYLTPTKEQLRRFEGVYRDLRVSYVLTRIHAAADGRLELENLTGKQVVRQVDPLLFEDENGSQVAFKENPDGTIGYMFSKTNRVSWVEKLPQPERFQDVPDNHPYAEYIEGLHQLGIVGSKPNGTFGPNEPLTRAEFVVQLMNWTGIPASKAPLIFEDIHDMPEAGKIQTALEYNFIKGTSERLFEPNRPILRQEAAAIMSRVMSGFGAKPSEGAIAGDTDPWAESAVKFIAGKQYYGPEVSISPDGAVDYRSKKMMTRQEAAALIYLASKWSVSS